MGLAGPRKRRKIGEDPNNTSWARSDKGYGQKILSAQGWTPGSYLGAKDAAQSAHFSHANASHIRVLLKDDNLGLGAKRGQAQGDNFGLTSLQDLYGRLNGKSDAQREKEDRYRADVNRKLYADRKWGSLRFVSGGVLVGDRIEAEPPEEEIIPTNAPSDTTVAGAVSPQGLGENESRTRNVTEIGTERQEGGNVSEADERERKKRTKEKRKKEKQGDEDSALAASEASRDAVATSPNQGLAQSEEGDATPETESKAERKARRRQRKLEKKARADADAPAEEKTQKSFGSAAKSSSTVSPEKSQELGEANNSKAHSNTSAAETMSQSTTRPHGPRLAVRQRFINQKRLSSMDPQALREILMLKS